ASLEKGNIPERKSKKGKSRGEGDEEVSEVQSVAVVETGDEILREYQRQIAQEEERATVKKTIVKKATTDWTNTASQEVMALNNEGTKKKKKKLKSLDPERETRCVEFLQDELITILFKLKNDPEVADIPRRPAFDDSLVLGVYIHRTDRLKTDLLVSHPMVKVHVIDEITGQYVKKEDSHRPVSSFYERESVEHILPIITQPFDFRKNKTTIPEWEEQIIFNERFGYFLQDNNEGPRVILFFEVLDFISMEEARANVDVDKHERGFRKIAWAFLKLVGTNGVQNIDSKLRLQLFCPPPRGKRLDNTIEVVDWWRRYPRSRYASTLYVTVKGLKLPDHVDPSIRSMMALQQERGSTSFSELQSETTRRTVTQSQDSRPELLRWSRMPGQVCRIPNKPFLSFRGGQMGCFTVRFSHQGRRLATACADRDAFPVVVYEIPSGKVLAAFNGHLSIVYDLCWSRDDRSLLSASSDGTVRMWDVQRLQAIARKVLPHPSFVYCAQFHPAAQGLVVSGGYDCLVRVWTVDVKDVNGLLLQEFEGHKSFINTLCFDSEGNRMFSADNFGVIIVWRTSIEDSSHQRPYREWNIEKEICESELSGLPINTLEVHPNGRRLLIHAKDSAVRVMDLRVLAVKKYTGATNYRERIHSTFTPCGSFIFSGSEDGMAYVWNAETGDQVAVYSELCYPTALRGVAFHPQENMVAFCAFGQSQPVHVYLYDHKLSQLEGESLMGRSRSGLTNTTTTSKSSEPVTFRETHGGAMDNFVSAARLSMKMQRVNDKLQSVLVSVPRVLVVSLYGYSANRSDELTVQRGDVIHVLYKDNENWWFGQLAGGQQGYFPASYVVEERKYAPLSKPRNNRPFPRCEPTDQLRSDERLTPTKVRRHFRKSSR
uniref:SH3 domain-containing protein n=1 Tax=Esox lucius TaxID=8010 RepID=A0A6Q2ZIV5_ESOLU